MGVLVPVAPTDADAAHYQTTEHDGHAAFYHQYIFVEIGAAASIFTHRISAQQGRDSSRPAFDYRALIV